MANKSTCKHVDSLRTSLQDLNHLQLNPSSASKLRTDLTNIEKQLAALKSQGGNSALSGQVKQLSMSVDKVKKAANGLSTPPTKAQATAVVTVADGAEGSVQGSAPGYERRLPQVASTPR